MEKEQNQIKKSINEIYEELFLEFKKLYPIKTPNGRRLQGNIDKCKELYKKHITLYKLSAPDIKKHEHIIKCLDFQVNEYKKLRKIDFFQMMQTWLNQKTWELYEEDVKNQSELLCNMINNNYYDDI